ncbi:uncharacterized protein GIQ15_03902 [Arthroderma uncinatum]|uniref:uncharacterized protein n=1 Tax=Arthroderma uncinatum TaxID=74035 RepID=UPI00144A9C79|nr:uncharacterized protein GIQ15_03902 [Arthroderma uncinatum]KAF3481143.1 hypothetical protein GIQ15_03902 [Arthroderma uncinatum]
MDPKLTDEEKSHVKSIRSKIQRARQGSSEEIYGSEDYWKHIKDELDGQGEVSSIRFRALQRGSDSTDPNFEQAAEEYMSQQERRNAKRLSILEKEKIFKKRNRVLQLSATTNVTSMRAAYVELLLSIKRKTSRQNQSNFSRDVLKAYGGTTRDSGGLKCFSVMDGTWQDKAQFVAAHIFPLSLGERTMEYIFGPDARYEINSPRNALLLPEVVERYFDTHQIAIVPAHSDESEVRGWKLFIIDKSGLWNRRICPFVSMTFSELHEQKLIFPNNFRPRARYLYFHYLTSMIIHFRAAKRAGVVRSELPDSEWPELTKAWATHGEYLRDSMIYNFIQEMGHDLPEELKENAMAHRVAIRSNSEIEEIGEVVGSLTSSSSVCPKRVMVPFHLDMLMSCMPFD